jgi:two-component system, cell cycle sensor histidine kinase and response regulator CckA
VLARVFEPFFTTKRSGGGTGMGLSTVYGIVKQSDGYVWVDSAPGAGTCVTILLPPADAAEPVQAAAAPPPVVRGHVFLVEDEEGVRDLLATVLRNAGFTVSVASSAEMALDMAPHLTFDLLLTDVVLPGITGPELARRVRESVPGMRVLFMSGYTGDALRDHADLGEVGGFIQKPFATKVLVDQIRQMLETGGRNPGASSGAPSA